MTIHQKDFGSIINDFYDDAAGAYRLIHNVLLLCQAKINLTSFP